MKKRGLTEYLIPVVAFAIWLLFELGGKIFGWETYPVGYWQKIAFGVFGMSIISGVTWIWLSVTMPSLSTLIDPDSSNFQSLTAWERVKLAALFFCFYGFGTVLLASLY